MEFNKFKNKILLLGIVASVLSLTSYLIYSIIRLENHSSLSHVTIVKNYLKEAHKKYEVEPFGIGQGKDFSIYISVSSSKKLSIEEARIFMLGNLNILQKQIDAFDDSTILDYYGVPKNELLKRSFLFISFNDPEKKYRRKPLTNGCDYVDDPEKLSCVEFVRNQIEYCIYKKGKDGYYGFVTIHKETLEEAMKIVKGEQSSDFQLN